MRKKFKGDYNERMEGCVLRGSELQQRAKTLPLAVFRIPSTSGSLKILFQQKCFRSHFVFSDPGRTRIVEKMTP